MKKYDSIIIGSGQAGTPLVFKLASVGEKERFKRLKFGVIEAPESHLISQPLEPVTL